jgi:hypothetical protein
MLSVQTNAKAKLIMNGRIESAVTFFVQKKSPFKGTRGDMN